MVWDLIKELTPPNTKIKINLTLKKNFKATFLHCHLHQNVHNSSFLLGLFFFMRLYNNCGAREEKKMKNSFCKQKLKLNFHFNLKSEKNIIMSETPTTEVRKSEKFPLITHILFMMFIKKLFKKRRKILFLNFFL